MLKESETLEFKRQLNDSIVKETIAFANTKGGRIIIGYDDNGKLLGVANAKDILDGISSKLHDSIEPKIDYLVSIKIANEENKEIIIIDVLQGISKPYYLKNKGMTSQGVYVRLGATTQMATSETIRQMIIESSGISFESNISKDQDLTFLFADKLFRDKNIRFTDIEKRNLNIINEDGLYTNLGLLMSDQCPYTIKMAIYKDNTKDEFIDYKETDKGCILKQLEEAQTYINLNNRIESEIKGFQRIENADYDIVSIRECLLNTVAHRDYEIPGSILVHIYKSKIDFLSLGGLVKGLTIEDIELGSSSSRNPQLVNILHRLNYVEAYGTGIPRIYKKYNLCTIKPEIKVAPNTFLISLPKIKYSDEYIKIMNYLSENQYITRENVENILAVGKHKAVTIINDFLESEIICKEGNGKNICYRINK